MVEFEWNVSRFVCMFSLGFLVHWCAVASLFVVYRIVMSVLAEIRDVKE